ncbi:DNA (cytosine-5-)-methyltransferase [Caviibacter abscessus]|uniref:DNA (cytosine-5-)-methyltransferase n=1 Tax=Caviibacter abscessus TaxID=1766719 RepID=UPI000AB2251C|nr:DNA (cytosine-5-)-methyltransferase [Caviibacter abscessus]
MLKFFDFCSGIGGGRIGLENNGLVCVGHCEIDKKTAETYSIFFNDDRNYGDLTKLDLNKLPNFDFMIAGFPCQTFSIVGKRKGFEDERGQIIYYLIEIMKHKKVKYFILENVKGLINHNKGKTFETIKYELRNAGYNIYYKVLNSLDYGVPQMRERIYIVGFKKGYDNGQFTFPNKENDRINFDSFLDLDNDLELNILDKTFQKYLSNKYNENKFTNEDILSWENCVIDWRQSDLRRYEKTFPTLRTGRHGLLYIKNKKIKKLNGYESLLLQGFPKHLAEKVKNSKFNNNKILSQAGNAMTVNVIESIVREMMKGKSDERNQ